MKHYTNSEQRKERLDEATARLTQAVESITTGQIDSLDEPYNGHRHWTDEYEKTTAQRL